MRTRLLNHRARSLIVDAQVRAKLNFPKKMPNQRATRWRFFSVLAYVLFASSLWDFYYIGAGIRVFDAVLLATFPLILLHQALGQQKYIPQEGHLGGVLVPLIVLVLINILYTAFHNADNIKAVIGVLLSLVMFASILVTRLDKAQLGTALSALIAFHSCVLLLQYIFYKVGGQVINPFSMLGLDVRVLSSVFRPAGLFREPASFAFQIFTFLSLKYLLSQKFDGVCWFGFACASLSFSLWGYVALTTLLLFIYWKEKIAWVFVMSATGLAVYFWEPIQHKVTASILTRRIQTLGEDGSVGTRYIGFLEDGHSIITDAVFWFGQGPSTSSYDYFGANGIGYMVSTWGVLISLFWAAGLVVKIQPGRRVFVILVVGLAATAAPMWTKFYWWVWLALVLRLASGSPAKAHKTEATANIHRAS